MNFRVRWMLSRPVQRMGAAARRNGCNSLRIVSLTSAASWMPVKILIGAIIMEPPPVVNSRPDGPRRKRRGGMSAGFEKKMP